MFKFLDLVEPNIMSAIASNIESISSQRSMDVTMVLRTRYIVQINIGIHIILAKIIHVAARWTLQIKLSGFKSTHQFRWFSTFRAANIFLNIPC